MRAMIRSTRLRLLAPSKNSLKRRSLPSSFGAASKRVFAQEGPDLLAARPFGGAKHRRDEAALAVRRSDAKALFDLAQEYRRPTTTDHRRI
jgi:hypothetical protein